MKTLFYLAILLCAPLVNCATVPSSNGVYLKSNGQWVALSVANSSGESTGGVGRSMLTGGIARVNGNTIFSGSTAPVSTSDANPAFCVIGPTHAEARDIVIVRLKEKRGHRELQTISMGAYRGLDMEYPPKDITHVVGSQSGVCWMVTPVSALKRGEYILFAGLGPANIMIPGFGGYDFSVSK